MNYLYSKISIPTYGSEIVARENVTDLFKEVKQGKSIYLSAPAGYGKTVALSCFAQNAKIPCAWYSLSDTDNDTFLFVKYLIQSIDGVLPEFKSSSFEKIADAQICFEHLHMLLNGIKVKPIIILDDFHVIDNPDIIKQIIHMIKCRNAAFIFSSRYDIDKNLEELILRQKIACIDKEELLFEEQDIRNYLKNKNINFSKDDVKSLEKHSGGWALAVVGLSANITYISEISNSQGYKYIERFLKHQVWDNLDKREKEVLKQTALLSEFTLECVQDLTGYIDAQNILQSLMHKCLFLSRTGADKNWYKYHHLFREFVVTEWSDEEEVAAKHKEIADYFFKNGDLVAAIEYYQKSGSNAEVIKVIDKNPRQILLCYDPSRVVQLIDSLKKYDALENINISICYGWALQHIRAPKRAQKHVEYIAQYLMKNEKTLNNDMKEKVELEIAAMSLPFLISSKDRSGVIECLTTMLLNNVDKPIVYNFNTVQSLYGSEYSLRDTISGFYGRHYFLIDIYEELSSINDTKTMIMKYDSISVAVAETFYEIGRIDKAQDIIGKHMDRARPNPKIYMPVMICFANIQKYKGDFIGAYSTISECMMYLKQKDDYMSLATLEAYKARLDCLLNNFKDAKEWEDKLSIGAYDDVSDISRHSLYQYLTLADVLSKTNRRTLAKMLITRIIAMLSKLPDMVYKSQALYMDALLTPHDISNEAFLQKAEKVFKMGFDDGYFLTFVDFGAGFKDMLSVFANHYDFSNCSQKYQDYFEKLTKLSDNYCEKVEKCNVKKKEKHTLTNKELLILELLAKGFSNQEIAEEMYVSLQTVKNRTSALYKKLGVKNRFQAVEKAYRVNSVDVTISNEV